VLIDAARIAPVAVTKYDKPFVVVMAVEEYERVMALDSQGSTTAKRKTKK
jgi:PHD/YefM family antitoxin component YafN of YafNO toxin-antitoxin module